MNLYYGVLLYFTAQSAGYNNQSIAYLVDQHSSRGADYYSAHRLSFCIPGNARAMVPMAIFIAIGERAAHSR